MTADETDAAVGADVTALDDDVLVRPLGFVPDDVVLARVGDRDAYIGNVHAADPAAHDRSFEYVLSATTDPQPLTTHHCPLVDGADNDWRTFAAAVETTRDLLARDGATLVHCRAGISRSTTLLAAAIAANEGRGLHEALDAVNRARPFATPNPPLLSDAITYLAANAPESLG